MTNGEYSDYHICCIYSIKEQAEKHAELIGGNVEDYELDDPAYINSAKKEAWNISLNEAGEVEWESRIDDVVGENVRVGRCGVYTGIRGTVFGAISYVSREHAIKLASELRQKWLVEQAGN